MKNLSRLLLLCAVISILIWTHSQTNALADDKASEKPSSITSIIYFTGIGCPHCANVDPILFKQRVRQCDLLIIEYEIYRDSINAPLLMAYNSRYDAGLAVPMIVAGADKDQIVVGDSPILKALDRLIDLNKGNDIVLPSDHIPFDKLALSDLPHKPKIWFKDRVAVKKDPESRESEAVKKFLTDGTEPQGCAAAEDKEVALSGDQITFKKSCTFNGWLLMNDETKG